MCHKHVKNLIALLGLILVIGSSTIVRAADISAFHAAIQKVHQPYKSALFYLRTGNAGVAGLELSTANAAWRAVIDQYANTPPDPITGDSGWAKTVEQVSAALDSGLKLAGEGNSKAARSALLPIREHLYSFRKRNGLRVMADCVYDLNAFMDTLYVWRRTPANLADASVQAEAKAASLNYINQLKLCRSEAPEALQKDADFKSVMDGAAKSADSLLKPIAEKKPDALINVLRELKSFDVIIFVRWG